MNFGMLILIEIDLNPRTLLQVLLIVFAIAVILVRSTVTSFKV